MELSSSKTNAASLNDEILDMLEDYMLIVQILMLILVLPQNLDLAQS